MIASVSADVRTALDMALQARVAERRHLRLVEPDQLPPDVTLIPKQQELFDAVLDSPYDNILYGGAYKGGKSRGFRLLATLLARRIPNANILFLRRTHPQLRDNHVRPWLREMPAGWATWQASDKVWQFPRGSVIVMGHCAHESNVSNFLGTDWDYIFIDELTMFTEFMVDAISSRLLTTKALTPKLIGGSNPGGIGHGWVKARWITGDADERSDGEPIDLSRYLFIPAKMSDNPHINYEAAERRLRNLPPEMRKAYLDGDWDIFAGQFFSAFRRSRHVIPSGSIEIPDPWPRFMAMDYGGTAKNVTLWGAYDKANDRVIVYRERVRAGAPVDVNAKEILDACNGDTIRSRRADPSIWARTESDRTSIYDQFARAGLTWQKATNNRSAGWALITRYLEVGDRPDGMPGLLILDCCPDLIKALPSLVYDERRPEDIKEAGAVDDHSPDALRYLLASIVGLGGDAKPQAGGDLQQMRQQSALGQVF